MTQLMIQKWSLGRVVREMGGKLVSSSIDVASPTGVSIDSRTLESGELFFALRGERFDGHDFVGQAADAGAGAVVVEDSSALPDGQTPGIVVDDTQKALGRLGYAIFRAARQQGIHSVAVTGSNGKTTTKELLAAIWGRDGTVWATPGNLNNHIGVPLTLCAIPAGCDHLIVEMGANHREEISELIRLAPADQRIITSIGRAHLEGFGSMAGVRKAKAEIFEVAGRATTAIMPHSEKEALAPQRFPGNIVTFGTERDADVRVERTEVVDRRGRMEMDVTIGVGKTTTEFALPLIGEHNAVNLAAALSTISVRGGSLPDEELAAALAEVELPAGRFRIVSTGELKILDDAYNANPSSMRASFQAFEQWCGDDGDIPAVAVVGDMNELGESAGRDHRRLARWLADRRRLSAVGFIGEYADMMADEADRGRIERVEVFADHQQAARWLEQQGRARVFLKGSRGARLEQIVEKLQSSL